MEKTLSQLYGLSRKRFADEALRLGLSAEEWRDIELKIITGHEREIPSIFFDGVNHLITSGIVHDVTAVHNFVRDFQAVVNHRVFRGSQGPETFFLRAIFRGDSSQRRKMSIDVPQFAAKVLSAHHEVDMWFNTHTCQPKRPGRKVAIRLINARSIAHHVLDWYFEISPFEAAQSAPARNAAIALYCLKRANEEASGTSLRWWRMQDIFSFGRWRSVGTARAHTSRVYAAVIDGVHDPELLLIDPLDPIFSGIETRDALVTRPTAGLLQGVRPHSQKNGRENILRRRRAIERKIGNILRTIGSNAGVNDVRDAIYDEKGSEAIAKILDFFQGGGGVVALEEIVDVIQEAWNYFPHRSLGGLSPAEKLIGAE